MLLSQVLDGSQVTLLDFCEHHGGVMCAERSRAGLCSLQSYQRKISPKHQCSGLCPHYSGAEQLALRQHWLSLFSQVDNQNCLPESDGDRYLTAIGKWETGCFPAFWGKNTHVVGDQCQQWQCGEAQERQSPDSRAGG